MELKIKVIHITNNHLLVGILWNVFQKKERGGMSCVTHAMGVILPQSRRFGLVERELHMCHDIDVSGRILGDAFSITAEQMFTGWDVFFDEKGHSANMGGSAKQKRRMLVI
jgi:hypothetical protein